MATTMNSLGITPVGTPLYPSSQDPEVNAGSRRYMATASAACPPAQLLEEHFMTQDGLRSQPRYNPLNKDRPRSSALLNTNDSMSMHLLVETAIYDSNEYEILSYEEVEDLKKEFSFLANRIDAAKRKLALESKVRDAALSLSRLYANKNKNRRKSLLGADRNSNPQDVMKHTDEELMASNRKCEEISQELWRLNNRAMEVQKRLLQHSAGILGMTHGKAIGSGGALKVGPKDSPGSSYTFVNGKPSGVMTPLHEEFDDRSLYRTPDNLDDFGRSPSPAANSHMKPKVDEDFLNERLEDLNDQFRDLLYNTSRMQQQPPPQHLPVNGAMHGLGVHEQLALLEQNIHYLASNPPALPRDPSLERAAQELERSDAILNQLWDMIISSEDEIRGQKLARRQEGYEEYSDDEDVESPSINREYSLSSFYAKVQALFAKSMNLRSERDTMREQLSRQHDAITNANSKMQRLMDELTNAQDQLNGKQRELETVMHELDVQRKKDHRNTMELNAQMEREAAALGEARHQNTELSDELQAKKDALAELELNFFNVQQDRDTAKTELDVVVAETDTRLQHLEAEIANLKQLRQQSDQARDTSVEESTHLRQQLAEKETNLKKQEDEIAELSQKVAQLSTEVVMAKAELDTAYGSRQQRAQETAQAQAAAAALQAASQKPQTVDPGLLQEIEDLSNKNEELIAEIVALKNERAEGANNEHYQKRCKDLQSELDGMLKDFEAMTKQGIENEQGRNSLEQTVDKLREKVEALETQLAEEKVRNLGGRLGSVVEGMAPGERGGRTPRTGESTSVATLRSEFKKMMRDMRAESARALGAEREERRKLEGVIRNLKKEQISRRTEPPTVTNA